MSKVFDIIVHVFNLQLNMNIELKGRDVENGDAKDIAGGGVGATVVANEEKARIAEEAGWRKWLGVVEVIGLTVVLVIVGGLLSLPSVFYFVPVDVEEVCICMHIHSCRLHSYEMLY